MLQPNVKSVSALTCHLEIAKTNLKTYIQAKFYRSLKFLHFPYLVNCHLSRCHNQLEKWEKCHQVAKVCYGLSWKWVGCCHDKRWAIITFWWKISSLVCSCEQWEHFDLLFRWHCFSDEDFLPPAMYNLVFQMTIQNTNQLCMYFIGIVFWHYCQSFWKILEALLIRESFIQ